jgi:uncharacterized Zn finger protein (UPF0148 family)
MNTLSFIAIRVGQKPPANYLKTGEHVVCPQCGATFSIARIDALADQKLVRDQITEMEAVLAGEHVDEKFADHLTSYEID